MRLDKRPDVFISSHRQCSGWLQATGAPIPLSVWSSSWSMAELRPYISMLFNKLYICSSLGIVKAAHFNLIWVYNQMSSNSKETSVDASPLEWSAGSRQKRWRWPMLSETTEFPLVWFHRIPAMPTGKRQFYRTDIPIKSLWVTYTIWTTGQAGQLYWGWIYIP